MPFEWRKERLVIAAAVGIAFAFVAMRWITPEHGGKAVYDSSCAACHEEGAHGAPRAGHREDWAPRLARGEPSLYESALKGRTQGDRHMPPRGGNPRLSDGEVKAAVDYLVGRSR